MAKYNARNAGRKPRFTEPELEKIRLQREQGMTVSKLAEEYRYCPYFDMGLSLFADK